MKYISTSLQTANTMANSGYSTLHHNMNNMVSITVYYIISITALINVLFDHIWVSMQVVQVHLLLSQQLVCHNIILFQLRHQLELQCSALHMVFPHLLWHSWPHHTPQHFGQPYHARFHACTPPPTTSNFSSNPTRRGAIIHPEFVNHIVHPEVDSFKDIPKLPGQTDPPPPSVSFTPMIILCHVACFPSKHSKVHPCTVSPIHLSNLNHLFTLVWRIYSKFWNWTKTLCIHRQSMTRVYQS